MSRTKLQLSGLMPRETIISRSLNLVDINWRISWKKEYSNILPAIGEKVQLISVLKNLSNTATKILNYSRQGTETTQALCVFLLILEGKE